MARRTVCTNTDGMTESRRVSRSRHGGAGRERSVPRRRAGGTLRRESSWDLGTAEMGVVGMIVVADALNIISRSGGAFASRWAHVVVGITWIGLLYYFNFVQVPAFAEMEAAARNNAIDKLASRALWWFRWAAVATVASGILILGFQEQLDDIDYFKTAPGMASPPASCSRSRCS